MLILTFKTDDVQAEISLYNDHQQLATKIWEAHRILADTIHINIVDVLMIGGVRLHELNGVSVFKGPGSFTGLRIGISVANALSYSLNIPITSGMGEAWVTESINALLQKQNERVVVPEYGALPSITKPKH